MSRLLKVRDSGPTCCRGHVAHSCCLMQRLNPEISAYKDRRFDGGQVGRVAGLQGAQPLSAYLTLPHCSLSPTGSER